MSCYSSIKLTNLFLRFRIYVLQKKQNLSGLYNDSTFNFTKYKESMEPLCPYSNFQLFLENSHTHS